MGGLIQLTCWTAEAQPLGLSRLSSAPHSESRLPLAPTWALMPATYAFTLRHLLGRFVVRSFS